MSFVKRHKRTMSRTPFWVRNLGAFWVLNSKNVDNKGFLKSHALRVPRGSFGEDPGNLDFSRFPGFFICAFRRVRSECILPGN